jgi:hypothetical protein
MYKDTSENSPEKGPYAVKNPYSKIPPLDEYTKARLGLSEYSMNYLPEEMWTRKIPLIPAEDLQKLIKVLKLF